MASALSMLNTLRVGDQADRSRVRRRDDLITIFLGLWLMIGVFVDGWAHNNLPILETFFTPWHALLYSGFLACSAWIVWLITRQIQHGRRGLAAVPFGTVALLFTLNAVLMATLVEFKNVDSIVVALATGLSTDVLIRALRAGPNRIAAIRTIATVVPLVQWGLSSWRSSSRAAWPGRSRCGPA